jgi:hypothetical protein
MRIGDCEFESNESTSRSINMPLTAKVQGIQKT